MQKIDWLRDMEEAQAYPEAKVVLREWTDSYSSTIVKVMETFTDRRDVGWMPVDVDHYNKWVIKRKNNKKLDDYYFPELADQTCETCAHNATTTDGITHCKFPECAHGNISRWKAKQEACSECKGLGRIYDMGDDDGTLNYTSETCPACNGAGTVAKKEIDDEN